MYITGSTVKILYRSDAGSQTVDLSCRSTNITSSLEQKEIPTPTFCEPSRRITTGVTEGKLTLRGFLTTQSPIWSSIAIGDTGVLYIYPKGTSATSNPYEGFRVLCQGFNTEYPADNVASLTATFTVTQSVRFE